MTRKRNKSQPLVSAIMAAYNAEKYIKSSIFSVLSQNYPNIELIIINDGSTDKTADIAKKITKSYKNVKLISQKNQGVVVARNNAIKHSSGELIAVVDSDDIWLPNKIETQVQMFLDDPKLTLVGGGYELIDSNGVFLGSNCPVSDHEDIMRGLAVFNQLGHSSCMYRKKTAEAIGLYPDSCPVEDYEFMYLMTESGKSFNLPYPVYRYRTETNGISETRQNEQGEKAKQLSNRIWERHTPRVLSRQEIIQKSKQYLKNPTSVEFGIMMKENFLLLNARVGYRMLRKRQFINGVKQLFNIASTGRTGLKIVIKHGWVIVRDVLIYRNRK